jgi:predicted membrane protein
MSRLNRQRNNIANGSGLWAGVIVLCIGLFIFLRKMGLEMPDWLFSWPMIIVAVGFLMGVKNKFQGIGWFIVTFVGCVFLVGEIVPDEWDISRFIFPTILIMVGVYMIGRAASRKQRYEEIMGEGTVRNSDDYIQSTTIFSGTNKMILSKNFQGGAITTVFGGTELNFTQADIQGEVVLDITTLFGGVEIVVPSSWDVRVDVATVFGGIEDKRAIPPVIPTNKVLVLKGSCTFGGVDLKSY